MRFTPAVTPPESASETHWQLAFVEGQLLLPADADTTLAPAAASHWQQDGVTRHYLGQLDGLDCWALHVPEAPPGWRRVPLRTAMMGLPEPVAGLASRAAQVLDWDRTHRYCGACATPAPAGPRAGMCRLRTVRILLASIQLRPTLV